MQESSIPTLPPPILPAQQSRVGYNDRVESRSPHSRGTGGERGSSLGPPTSRSISRSRGGYERESSEWGRDRSESREGRTGSRVPLFRRNQAGGKEGDAEKSSSTETSAGDGWEDVEQQERGEKGPGFLGKLGRHFIGIRDKHSFKSPIVRPLRFLSQPYENYLLAFFGAFVAILGAGGISYAFKDVGGFEGDTPLAIGSLGATAVLLYVVPESPLSQPRAVIGGHMVSALSGVIISQLFALNDRFSEPINEDNTIVQPNSWYHLTPVAYALAVAIAIFGMQVTKTVHPPGGATALIASAHRTVDGRYTYLLDIFLAVTWMTLWSFFVNNLGRRKYPTFWWTPKTPPPPPVQKQKEEEEEKNKLPTINPLSSSSNTQNGAQNDHRRLGNLREEEDSNSWRSNRASLEETQRGRQIKSQ
ncbi:HPP family protein [Sporobolomyces salmoneus]|uniref:HPP family protein n=1 Tax=Sporobolomyces salmoneus TaxID=183962 RepID=UPI003177A9F9